MKILMSSRRTVMDGEVVTLETAFMVRGTGAFASHEARGPFEVSASRNAVMVHRAETCTCEACDALLAAIRAAESIRANLAASYRGGGAPSKYPSEPTEITTPSGKAAKEKP